MKITISTICLAIIVSFVLVEAAGPFDGVNVDQMLANPGMVQRQIKCLSCKGPCDKIGSELKRVIPVVAATNCRSCSTSEKVKMGKIVNHVQSNYPREWQELNAHLRSGRRC